MEEINSVQPNEQTSQALVEVVRSQAVVKYCNTQSVQQYIGLACNTNLNTPPCNWLTTATAGSNMLHQALHQRPYFASFNMAHQFIDCAGDVDIVSDAENMKTLLKLPYMERRVISMMVHKVGNTLLLDDFDISTYLLRNSKVEWAWLRKFLINHIINLHENKKNSVRIDDRTVEASKKRNLQSKFLYRSLTNEEAETDKPTPPTIPAVTSKQPVLPEPNITENVPDPKSQHNFHRNVLWQFENVNMLIGTDMLIFGGPDRPCVSLRLSDVSEPINVLTGIDLWLDNLMCNVPEVLMCYHLDGIVQKYEIIKTEDLPNLENSKFSPQVVRNVAHNILAFLKMNATKAGHTYWLFKGVNDDVVKLYDLTTLCQVETAKSTSSSPGKEPPSAENLQNPFTTPVGMLLYSVARNMKNSKERMSAKRAGAIRSLLTNCINLLPKEKYPQIVTSSHYMLADLYLPVGIDPKDPLFDSFDDDDDDEWDEEFYNNNEDLSDDESRNANLLNQTAAGELFKNGAKAATPVSATTKEFDEKAKDHLKAHTKIPPPLNESVEERCAHSLKHIRAGLECLQFFNQSEEMYLRESEERAKQEEKLRIIDEEQNPNMAKPDNPIPLPYERLQNEQKSTTTKKTKGEKSQDADVEDIRMMYDLLDDEALMYLEIQQIRQNQREKQQRVITKFNEQEFGSWSAHLKLLLLEKAILTFATMAECQYDGANFGYALRDIHAAMRCQHVISKYMVDEISHQAQLISRAGDCFFQISKNWQNSTKFIEDYHNNEQQDVKAILQQFEKDFDSELNKLLISPVNNLEALLNMSIKCYKVALDFTNLSNVKDEGERNELWRRLGNVQNELGLKYMHWSQEEHNKCKKLMKEQFGAGDDPKKNMAAALDKSCIYHVLAIKSFDALIAGIEAFGICEDKTNLAFMYCNLGRYYRFRAHLINPIVTHITPIIMKEMKNYYNRAFKSYEDAFEILNSRELNPTLWDLVHWELTSATFSWAKHIQETTDSIPEYNSTEFAKIALEMLQKALKLCQQAYPDSRKLLYTYRSGLIHKRIAYQHYQRLRGKSLTSQQFKSTLALCVSHYEKAMEILEEAREYTDLISIQLDRIALYEYMAEDAHNGAKKVKYLYEALDVIFIVPSLLVKLLDSITDDIKTESRAEWGDDTKNRLNDFLQKTLIDLKFDDFLNIYEQRLQFVLKTLLKEQMSGKQPKKMANILKQMYMKALKDGGPPKADMSVAPGTINWIIEHAKNIIKLMKAIEDIYKEGRMLNGLPGRVTEA